VNTDKLSGIVSTCVIVIVDIYIYIYIGEHW